MDETVTPYELPDVENHSFFFINPHIPPDIEAKLHQHDAWELYVVVQGRGNRTTGDTLLAFGPGDAVLIPPGMIHQWNYDINSTDNNGQIHYLMVAFSSAFVEKSKESFPEIRNSLKGIPMPADAIKFGVNTSRIIRRTLTKMVQKDELGRLCEMLQLLPLLYTSADHILVGKPFRIEKDIRRMQQVCVYVMTHYKHNILLDDVAKEIGMNRSAFCTFFKRCKGMTFSHYLTNYRLNTACELLKNTQKQISEICYSVGYNDFSHFVRVFSHTFGKSPSNYRKDER